MKIANLSGEDLAQLAIAVKARMTTKGRYTELVGSIDRRLSNIERMVAKLASDEKPKHALYREKHGT